MKYYKIDISLLNNNGRISSSASIDKIQNIENLFEKIRYGSYIDSFPILDSFYLESYDEEQYWEDQKNDVHTFIGKANIIVGWYISDNFKKELELFKVAPELKIEDIAMLADIQAPKTRGNYKKKEINF